MTQDIRLSTLDRQDIFLDQFLETNVFTSLPARVTNVDNLESKQTIEVKVGIRRVFRDRAALEGADLYDVPVVFPSAGGGLLSFPIKVGDTVLVVFSKRCIDEWMLGEGSDTSPQLFRQFDIADGIAIPGLYPEALNLNPDPDHVVLKFAGSSVTLFNNGDSSLVSPGNADIDSGGNLTAVADGNITVDSGGSINATATGNISLNAGGSISLTAGTSISFNAPNVGINSTSATHNGTNIGSTHTHPQGTDSDGNSEQNTGTPI